MEKENETVGKQESLAKYIWMLAAPAMASIVSAIMFIVMVSIMAGRGYDLGGYQGAGELAGIFVVWILVTIAAVIAAVVFYIIGLVKIAKVKDGEGEHSGLATAGFVLGICGVSLLALIFGAVSLSKKVKNRGMAAGALYMGVSSVAAGIIWVIAGIVMSVILANSAFRYGSNNSGMGEINGGGGYDSSSREDEDRREAVDDTAAALLSYAANNRGQLPDEGLYVTGYSSMSGFAGYLGDVDRDIVYQVTIRDYDDDESFSSEATKTGIDVVRSAQCLITGESGSGMQIEGDSARDAAIIVQLSGGSYYCQDY